MVEEPGVGVEVAEQPEEQVAEYDLHVKLDRKMQKTLKDASELAYLLGVIPKPDLVDLMNLVIGWGLNVLKRMWLDRMGYK